MRSSTIPDLGTGRGRVPVWIGLAAIVALSWVYLARMNADMSGMMGGMAHHAMARPGPGLSELILAVLLWSAMMVAMMVPTTIPAVSLFTTLSPRRNPANATSTMTALFVAGYVVAWIGYAVAAALAQWMLQRGALLTPMAESASGALSAAILVGAGVFQFTPVKEACLTKCRTPLAFFLAEWRDGKAGAFVLGLRHGRYCVVCCWALMAVMLMVGAMNLIWMALFTVFLLGEKVAPARWQISRISGAILVAWGGWIAAGLLA